ncbi:nuclear factor 7, ovary-like [Podarcis lilfordi]|uniref:Nuclear factor 7, ovary-like n=1 Tax=Podarcis lilfordi TaxID=74358 RepID=A0AA35JXS4_9SAUR|nr:nuclear factor 7, ovary-like [Podarcis lilfordi]
MTSVREVSSIAEDLLCPVCLSIFQDPRMLVCGHNFCLSCLESCVVPKGQHQGTCPECRDTFDLKDAARNRVLANLSEKARLLRLEQGPPSGGTGSSYFCEEHEEPLKLFCSQDEAPVCVICRDLPQHQGHSFLPIKNAVTGFQDKLKASLEPLENGVKWAINNQSQQQEAMEELENLNQHLCGCIFIAFEELREILNEREQNMMETVRQMKEENQAEMERRLEYLRAFSSAHTETISGIEAALAETNEFAFLKGVKELTGRVQERLKEQVDETAKEACEGGEGEEEIKEEGNQDEDAGENLGKGKAGGDVTDEEETYEGAEAQGTEGEDEEWAIVPVDPALEELEELLDFDSWKEMLRSISIRETFVPDLPCHSPTPEKDMPQLEDSDSLPKEAPWRSAGSTEAPIVAEAPPQPPRSSYFRGFQQMPFLGSFPPFPFGGQFGPAHGWMSHPRLGRGPFQGRRGPRSHPFGPRRGQGRGYYPNTQTSQPGEGKAFPQHRWMPPRNEPPKAREAQVAGQGGQGKPEKSGGESSVTEHPKPREAHGSGRIGRGGWSNKQKTQSSADQSGGGSVKNEARASGQAGSGQGQGSAKRPPTPNKGGEASGNKGSQNKYHGGRGRGRGRGSAKGPQNK